MASFLYNSLQKDMSDGNVTPGGGDTFKMLLVTSTYAENKDHSKRSDVTNEVSGTGYTAGGKACTVTFTTDNVNDRTSISISTPSWTSSTFTAAAAVVYKDRGGVASADELVAFLDFGGDVTVTNGTFSTSETSPFYINH